MSINLCIVLWGLTLMLLGQPLFYDINNVLPLTFITNYFIGVNYSYVSVQFFRIKDTPSF